MPVRKQRASERVGNAFARRCFRAGVTVCSSDRDLRSRERLRRAREEAVGYLTLRLGVDWRARLESNMQPARAAHAASHAAQREWECYQLAGVRLPT